MLFIIGSLVVIVTVLGGYGVHGSYGVLWQPIEFLIIFGGAIGAFIIANPKRVLSGSLKAFGRIIGGPKKKKKDYEELLTCLFTVFRLAKTKGDLALEAHIEKPQDSTLFQSFPSLHQDHHALEFLCDYLRLVTLGATTPHEIEAIMDNELEIHHEEDHAVSGALQTMADALPALGIVAAVLGVIVTMSSISEPPEVLGGLIAAALVGTFSGILASYGFVAPMAASVANSFAADAQYMACIKAGLMGHIQGYAPQVSVEFARKTLGSTVRPTFAEIEELVSNAPQVGT
jgi:chemotaxis protein MotA